MSIIDKSTISCPKCGHSFSATRYDSVNTDLGKDIPQKVISGELFRATCPSCGAKTLLAYNILYHDMKNESMIWVIIPNGDDYSKQVEEVRRTQKIIPYKNTRIVPGMRELSEKVSCLEAKRDDRVVEICRFILKCQLMEQHPEFKVVDSYYTYSDGEEIIYFYDRNGNDFSCKLDDNIYNNIISLIDEYSAELPSEPFQIIDSEWAERFFINMVDNEESDEEENTSTDYIQPAVVKEESPIDYAPVRNRFCRKCGHQLHEDSIFCDKCGTKIISNSELPTNTSPTLQPSYKAPTNVVSKAPSNSPSKNAAPSSSSIPSNPHPAKSSSSNTWLIFIGVLVALVILLYVFGTSDSGTTTKELPATQSTLVKPVSTPTPKPSPLPLPKTGEIFSGELLERDSLLTIHSSSSSSCFIKLKNSLKQDVFTFFVRAGDSVEMAVPSGNYYVYFAYGDEWYGVSKCFGEDTYYSKDDDLLDFYNYTWEYTLYSTANGNFDDTPISEDEF